MTEYSEKQKINLTFTNCTLFFKHLTANCESIDTTYINWKCTPDKKTLCDSIKSKWEGIKQEDIKKEQWRYNILLLWNEKQKKVNSSSDLSQNWLAGLIFIPEFITKLLPKIINHPNHLKHYCTNIYKFWHHCNTISTDADFSENLKILVTF